ncbi:uncharacterized protein LOC115984913 [Quercus lobata]|uniref:uncharacterized protein LOC115984913 n=1 Tax=Quercus lobata TaxID=97700 RepID=UPI0012471AC2|nr:uncharacterized protein LOC115984913 [Quercus lobata]
MRLRDRERDFGRRREEATIGGGGCGEPALPIWFRPKSEKPLCSAPPIPAVVPVGGTTARLMLDLWPSLQLEGWEIDEILIEKSREYLGLSDLEKHTVAGGILNVHIGNALSQSVNASGGFAGIVVDLFSGGKVLPRLQEVQTWLELNDRLMPNGRLMVNCGGIDEAADVIDGVVHPKNSSIDDT